MHQVTGASKTRDRSRAVARHQYRMMMWQPNWTPLYSLSPPLYALFSSTATGGGVGHRGARSGKEAEDAVGWEERRAQLCALKEGGTRPCWHARGRERPQRWLDLELGVMMVRDDHRMQRCRWSCFSTHSLALPRPGGGGPAPLIDAAAISA